MVLPALRYALKYGPVALEVARQVDRQLRPHIMAYRLARAVDGYVASWSAKHTHWVVFPTRDGAPLKAFPPLPDEELATITRELDRTTLRHHGELLEAKVKDRTDRVVQAPVQVVRRLRRSDDPGSLPPPVA